MIIQRFKTLSEQNLQVDWLVDGLISSGSWTYLVGEAGSGKSMMCIQLCDALQDGKPFLGMKTKKSNCLYVQVDAGTTEWKIQVRSLAGDSFAWTMYQMTDTFLDAQEEVQRVKDVIWATYDTDTQYSRVLKHEEFDFIVFDVLNQMTAQDINTKVGFNYVLKKLMYMTSIGQGEGKLSKHFILVHHPSASVKRGVMAGSGYKGFGGACGNMLTLGNNLLVLEKSKVTGKKELLLERDTRTGAWLLPGNSFQVEDNPNFDIYKELGIER